MAVEGRRLNSALALLDDDLLELLDHALDLLQVGIDAESTLEVHEGLLRLVELHVNLAITGQRAPVLGIALDHLVAVLQRLVVLADEEVDGRPLVPAFRELGLAPDDLAEGADGSLGLTVVHLLHPDREEPVDGGIARAAPDLPDGVLGERTHEIVGIAQEPEDGRQVLRGADLAHPGGGAPSRLRVGSGELAECLLAGEGLATLAGDRGDPGDGESHGDSEEKRSHDRRPIMSTSCASSRVGTPRRRASSALETASLASSGVRDLRPPVRTSVLPVRGPGVSDTPASARSRPTSRRRAMVFRLRASWKKRAVLSAILGPMPGISLISSAEARSSRSMVPKRAARSWAARSPIMRMPRPLSTRERPRPLEARRASTRLVADFFAMRSSPASCSTSSS